MNKIAIFICVLALAANGCTKTEVKPPECEPVLAIATDSICTTSQPKLKLTAQKYKLTSDSQFEWYIYAFKDVASINLIEKYRWTTFSKEDKLIVPDSVVKDNPVVIVKISSICNGKRIESPGFGFIRERSAKSNCEAWRSMQF